MAKIKDHINYKQLAQQYMNKYAKKGKLVPEVKNVAPGEFVIPQKVNLNAVDDKAILKKYVDWDFWAAPVHKPAQVPVQPFGEKFLEIPNPNKFLVDEVEVPLPQEPDPYVDNLSNVVNELQEVVDYAFANGEEPPLTLVRALNRITQLEKDGGDWVAGYNVGWADAGGVKHQPDDPPPEPDEWPGVPQ
jgi:hypothetical protein